MATLIQNLWVQRDELSIEKQKLIIQKWLADNGLTVKQV